MKNKREFFGIQFEIKGLSDENSEMSFLISILSVLSHNLGRSLGHHR